MLRSHHTGVASCLLPKTGVEQVDEKNSVISKPVPFLLDYQGQPPLLPTAKFPTPQKGFQINLSSQVQSIQLCNLGGIPLHWATCT